MNQRPTVASLSLFGAIQGTIDSKLTAAIEHAKSASQTDNTTLRKNDFDKSQWLTCVQRTRQIAARTSPPCCCFCFYSVGFINKYESRLFCWQAVCLCQLAFTTGKDVVSRETKTYTPPPQPLPLETTQSLCWFGIHLCQEQPTWDVAGVREDLRETKHICVVCEEADVASSGIISSFLGLSSSLQTYVQYIHMLQSLYWAWVTFVGIKH